MSYGGAHQQLEDVEGSAIASTQRAPKHKIANLQALNELKKGSAVI